ncbi:hypothetical protein VTN77DRAFT_7682 [Rasamsonia byssochlamydoides]|uniref:uncharacterized protein n=1 Tax=Rasamsonia byssochlamydoides TaxID=89139 RepID=UPI0037445598
MRILLTEMLSVPARRQASSISLRYRRTVQRRRKSTEAHTGSDSGSPSQKPAGDHSADVSSTPPAGSVASSAGAASALLPTTNRSVWKMVKSSPIGKFGRWYTRAQERRPYVTQVASSFVIYLCGDLSAQLLFPTDVKAVEPVRDRSKEIGAAEQSEEESEQKLGGYDPLRTLRHLTVGLVSSIPSYKWFMFLHHNFNYSSKFLSILTKVSVQQAVFTPVFNTYFFSMQSLLAGATLEETWERVKRAVPTSIKNSVKLWPAVTAFSFMYVPPHFRSVFGGSVAVGWQTYLSWLNQKAAREVAAVAAAEQGATPVLITESSVTSQAVLRP